MNKIIATATTFALSLYSLAAQAHPGIHGDEGLVQGLSHQFTQVDHLSTFLIAAIGVVFAGVVVYRQRKHAKAKK